MSRIRRGPIAPGFEAYQDRAGKWRWRLFAANGLVVATGNECFASRANCVRAVGAVKKLIREGLSA